MRLKPETEAVWAWRGGDRGAGGSQPTRSSSGGEEAGPSRPQARRARAPPPGSRLLRRLAPHPRSLGSDVGRRPAPPGPRRPFETVELSGMQGCRCSIRLHRGRSPNQHWSAATGAGRCHAAGCWPC